MIGSLPKGKLGKEKRLTGEEVMEGGSWQCDMEEFGWWRTEREQGIMGLFCFHF